MIYGGTVAKRFTDTEKWKDEWFLELEPTMKVFWIYLCDTCDNAGFWKENFKHASFFVGTLLDKQSTLKALGERIKILPSKKWYIKKFIPFQYGDALYENNPAHKSVIHLLNFEGMTDEVEILPEAGVHTRKRIGKTAKERIFYEASFTCEYCGSRPEIKELVIDHIIPVAKGGSNSNANLACACVSCNAKKSAISLEEFIAKYNLSETSSEKIKTLLAPFKKLKAPNNFLLAPLDKDKDTDTDKEMDKDSFSSSLNTETKKNLPNEESQEIQKTPSPLSFLFDQYPDIQAWLDEGSHDTHKLLAAKFPHSMLIMEIPKLFSWQKKKNGVRAESWMHVRLSSIDLNGYGANKAHVSKTPITPDNDTGNPYIAELKRREREQGVS